VPTPPNRGGGTAAALPALQLALAKLRAALAGTVAGTKPPAEMLRAVFDEREIR
jgi:hypothetical protein